MTISKQFRLLPECRDQGATALHRAQIPTCALAQVAEVACAVVRHGVMLQVAPDVFDGVQFRRVGRQMLKSDAPVQALDVLFDQPRAMRLQAVPDDQQLLADRLLQRFEELNDLGALDRTGEESKVKAPVTHAGDDRELLPGEAVLQERCLTLRGPGACAAGSFGQTRFVDEDDYSALPRSDFFMAGQRFSFHVRIAASSRSRARPAGRCTLQPSCCSMRHTEGCESSTPNRSLIIEAMRGSVHSSLAKPAAKAPPLSVLISSARCASSSLGGRPKRSGRFKASAPPRSVNFVQRRTDCRVTPTRRATSAAHRPWANSRMPRLRRFSNSFNCCSIPIRTSNITIRSTSTARVGKSVIHLRKSQ